MYKSPPLLLTLATAAGLSGCVDIEGWEPDDESVSVARTLVGSDTLRLGTFNVAMIPSTILDTGYIAECAADGVEERICRAEKIAQRIRASEYDVIALNEVFDEDGRTELVDELSGDYPYYVSKLDADGWDPEDSGLMLFSKWAVVENGLDLTTYVTAPDPDGEGTITIPPRYRAFDQAEGDSDTTRERTGFVMFDSSDGDDSLAAKGAGLVRLRNPVSLREIDVVFSHMQADGENWESRRDQFHDIQDMLAARRDVRQTFILGDLNVDGDKANSDLGEPSDTVSASDNRWEWNERFVRDAGLPSFQGRDAWFNTTSTQDFGLTNGGERLDYVVTTQDSSDLCVQHLSLGYNMGIAESGVAAFPVAFGPDLGHARIPSDHMPVNADLAPMAAQCSPSKARTARLDVNENGKFEHPGNVQWWFLPGLGGYSFTSSTNNIRVEFYRASDLSRELTPDFLTTSPNAPPVPVFASPESVFAKVIALDPSVLAYKVKFHKNNCTRRSEACPLLAGMRVKTNANASFYEEGAIWHYADTETSTSGAAQTMRFRTESSASAGASGMRIELRAGTVTRTSAVATWSSPLYSVTFDATDGVLDGQRVFVLVKPSVNPVTEPIVVNTSFRTNLTRVFGAEHNSDPRLRCEDETEEGRDEVSLHVKAEASTSASSTSAPPTRTHASSFRAPCRASGSSTRSRSASSRTTKAAPTSSFPTRTTTRPGPRSRPSPWTTSASAVRTAVSSGIRTTSSTRSCTDRSIDSSTCGVARSADRPEPASAWCSTRSAR